MEIELDTVSWEPWITIQDGDWCYPRTGHWFSWTWRRDMNYSVGKMIYIDDLMRVGQWK